MKKYIIYAQGEGIENTIFMRITAVEPVMLCVFTLIAKRYQNLMTLWFVGDHE